MLVRRVWVHESVEYMQHVSCMSMSMSLSIVPYSRLGTWYSSPIYVCFLPGSLGIYRCEWLAKELAVCPTRCCCSSQTRSKAGTFHSSISWRLLPSVQGTAFLEFLFFTFSCNLRTYTYEYKQAIAGTVQKCLSSSDFRVQTLRCMTCMSFVRVVDGDAAAKFRATWCHGDDVSKIQQPREIRKMTPRKDDGRGIFRQPPAGDTTMGGGGEAPRRLRLHVCFGCCCCCASWSPCNGWSTHQ